MQKVSGQPFELTIFLLLYDQKKNVVSHIKFTSSLDDLN